MASKVAEQGKRMVDQNKKAAREAANRRKNVHMAQQRDTRFQEVNVVDEQTGALTRDYQFPVTLMHADSRDEDMQIKAALTADGTGIQRYLTPEDVDYYKAKEEQAQYEREMQWVIQRTNWNDPVQISQIKEMFPEVIEMMKRQLDDEFAIAKQFAKIRMLGAQDADDVRFEMYLADGSIILPKPGFWKGGSALGDDLDYVPGVFAYVPDLKPPGEIPASTRYGVKSRAQGEAPANLRRMRETQPESWQAFNNPTFKPLWTASGMNWRYSDNFRALTDNARRTPQRVPFPRPTAAG